MASANVELVRSIFSAWERGDFSSAEWAHPDIEFLIVDGPDPGTWTGLAGMAAGWRGRLEMWDDFRVEPIEFRELGEDRVLVLNRSQGRGRSSGLDVGQVSSGATLFHMRAGKVTRLVVYFYSDRALADVGLGPESESQP